MQDSNARRLRHEADLDQVDSRVLRSIGKPARGSTLELQAPSAQAVARPPAPLAGIVPRGQTAVPGKSARFDLDAGTDARTPRDHIDFAVRASHATPDQLPALGTQVTSHQLFTDFTQFRPPRPAQKQKGAGPKTDEDAP